MPELPEVERGRQLAEAVVRGKRIAAVACAVDSIVFDGTPAARVRRALRGRRVQEVRRWGKQLWFGLDAPPHPLFHFGMSGAFRTRGDVPLALKAGPKVDGTEWPPRWWKIRLTMDDGAELVMTDARRLGRIRLRADPCNEPPISRLGFDPLLALPAPAAFAAALAQRDAVIKSLLLDQQFSAGVGNWIADEALYQAGIDPRRRASTLSPAEARRLRSVLGRIVRRAVAALADDARYPRTWLFHRRWGKRADAVTLAGERIEHLTIGGRTTAWVPSRQG